MSFVFPGLPDHWQKTRLDRVATVNARIGWKALTASEYQPEGYAFLATPNIKGAEIDFENVNYISEYRYLESPELQLTEGDVLLAKDGNTLGVVNVTRGIPRPATVNGSIAVLRSHGINSRFLRYVIASSPIQGHIGSVKDGMGVPHLFQRDIKQFPVPLPPLEEQRRIADFLDAETARIDKLVGLRKRQMALIDERYESALEREFNADSSRETRLKYLLAMRPRYGVLVPSFVDEGVPLIRVNDLLDLAGRSEGMLRIPGELSAQYSRTVTREGDVLLSVVGTLGRSAIVPGELASANVNRAIAVLRPLSEVSNELLAIWLTTRSFIRQALDATASDTAQRTLGMEDLSNFRLPWPDRAADLKRLYAAVRAASDRRSKLSKVFQRQVTLLEERRQALITAAVTGQIDVSTASGRGIEE
ncbi:restriction endonuclease subunit S [Saccharopolyspora cebuensis]|uniref:restriction endonuclease subunit S n=1 Tax=Saccharopolyspora cebuensis TaxID=418759 RepID=UPI0031EA18BA